MKKLPDSTGMRILATISLICCASAATAFDADDLAISIRGDDPELTEVVQTTSRVSQAIRDGRTNAQDLVSAARSDYRQLLGALYEQGYFSPVISVTVDGREVAEISPLNDPDTVSRIAITIDPGAAFRFSRAEIGPLAQNSTPPEEFSRNSKATVSVIQSAASDGISAWRATGRAKARVADQDIIADHDTSTLDVSITLDPGPKLTFGALRIQGNDNVREERVRAIAGLPVGETFDPEELDLATARLRPNRRVQFRQPTRGRRDRTGEHAAD